MNIQLRDSKTLQDALYKLSDRNALPKAQLHPELLEPHLDTESGGFIVRSKNKIDIGHLESFLPQSSVCTANWKFSGRDASRIPSELVFDFECGGKLAIRTQSAADVTRLTSIIPSDRGGLRFDGHYDDGRLMLVRAVGQKELPSSNKSDAELQLDAAKAGVKWDKKASRETMIERIEEAKKATVT